MSFRYFVVNGLKRFYVDIKTHAIMQLFNFMIDYKFEISILYNFPLKDLKWYLLKAILTWIFISLGPKM
jgi:hypothetical protein